MMSQKSKRELLETIAPRYHAAGGEEKTRILDEFVTSTGYHRKYAIYLLQHPYRPEKRTRRRKARIYTPAVKYALVQVWRAVNCICGKRLVPYLPEFVAVMEHHEELQLDAPTRALLLRISAATADRLLRAERQSLGRRGVSTTKPGTLLKSMIPIRTFADWDDARPGFMEIDLVAHCGTTSAGDYLHTLVMTDITTGWTECLALRHRSQQAVTQAIDQARDLLPFPLLGIDSDNGAEFINDLLLRYCQRQHITFTRCRPYKKNDQAHVEQKNWSIVRQFVGYDRLEGNGLYRLLLALYRRLRLYINFFQPVMKLVSKERVGAKLRKHYDLAKTPYHRVLASDQVSVEHKDKLRALYPDLNPVTLLREIESLQHRICQTVIVRSSNEATNPPG